MFELQVRSRSGTFGVQPHTSSAPVVTPSPLRPRATESTFWVASCMPSTSNGARFIGISVNKMETCVVGGVADDEWPLWAFLNVSASCLIEDHGSISAFARPRRGWLEVEDVVYESAGGDAVNLMVVGADDFMRLLTDDDGPASSALLVTSTSCLCGRATRCTGEATTSRWPTCCWNLPA